MKYLSVENVLDFLLGFFLALCFFSVFGCTIQADPQDPTDVPTCQKAEDHLVGMQCDDSMMIIPGFDEQEGTADDWEWHKWCENQNASGIFTVDTKCIMGAPTCGKAVVCIEGEKE